MKLFTLNAALICAALMATLAHLSAQPAPSAPAGALGPRLSFATNRYNFGKITGGAKVKYVYLLTNTGDQTLEIFGVTPGCHCTTAGDWTHHVAPGQTGTISIQFDSGNFSGGVTRTIAVTSNDRVAPRQTLFLGGTIWQPFKVSPQFVYIHVPSGAISNATSNVRITSLAGEPVTLSNPTSATSSFKAELKTLSPGKEFEVIITAIPPLAPGTTVGRISIQTSSTNMPLLTITTMAAVQPPPLHPKAMTQNPLIPPAANHP
jgi:hypothetical protein